MNAYTSSGRIPPVLNSLLARLVARFRGEKSDGERASEASNSVADEATNERADDAEFRPSRLDASVLFAHGQRVDYEGDDADELDEKARELERERRKR